MDTKLRDPDRKPFYSADDERLTFLKSMASGFSHMTGGKGVKGHCSLTSETRNAVVLTLQGIVHLIQHLLSLDHTYVLPGHLIGWKQNLECTGIFLIAFSLFQIFSM